jgi:hypothetical protein
VPNRSVARLGLHTSICSFPAAYPPHSTIPGKTRSHSFAPARAAMYTPVRRHAPTSPLNAATRAHTSRRETVRSTLHLARARVEGGATMGACYVDVCARASDAPPSLGQSDSFRSYFA